mmetsp:Transcript_11758/g.16431  ORF Transcript_11758/g.16431 Transcript_11758/m.16431 type:complete len:134 (+) Transcript_11758:2-403(+)
MYIHIYIHICIYTRSSLRPPRHTVSPLASTNCIDHRINLKSNEIHRILAELCLPFVSVGGYFFAMKGPLEAAEEEIRNARVALEALGGEVESVVEVGALAKGLGPRTVVVVRKVRETPGNYPRAVGRPNKKPL